MIDLIYTVPLAIGRFCGVAVALCLLLPSGSAKVRAECETTGKDNPSCCAAEPLLAPVAGDLFVGKWIDKDQRTSLINHHSLIRHDGAPTSLSGLLGRPTVISFVYTRCNNPNKCPAVMAAFTRLSQQLENNHLLSDVNLALISYDAQWDSVETINSYARLHGLALNDRVSFYVPQASCSGQFFKDLDIKVSINSGGITLHKLQLFLLDAKGNLARSYDTVLWDNNRVLADLRQLLAEER